MKTDVTSEIDKYSLRKKFRRFVLKAFGEIPEKKAPRILLLGCGTGIAVIEIVLLSGGFMDAVDDDRKSLRVLDDTVRALNLDKCVRLFHRRYDKLNLRHERYDIVWAEGIINTIGFENGIAELQKYMKSDGCMVIHDEIYDYKRKLEIIEQYGFRLIKYFVIPPAVWMEDYFKPLGERIASLKEKYSDDKDALDALEKEESEIDRFKAAPEEFASVYYVFDLTASVTSP